MGLLPTVESWEAEVEEFRRTVVACAALHRRKDDEGLPKSALPLEADGGDEGTMVCVTSGVSYLGMALANQLLLQGYSVRITVHNSDDMEKLREMERTRGDNLQVVMANLTDVQSLRTAFDGCRGVFHTSAFTDPAGLSGYTKSMAEIEVRATQNVMEACATTPSVKKCVFTSSLSACLWQDNARPDVPSVINHASWSSESLCIDSKLWYALGKTRAEKRAWKIAAEQGLQLATICPALITGPEFCRRNPTATIAYLKGAQEMYSHGLLATVDVVKVAEAHVCVYKAMDGTASGRYVCFDRVIDSPREAEKLAKQTGMPVDKICGNQTPAHPYRIALSNQKLCRLMSRPLTCYSQY
ncbi:cinnamoyl-CoA reductase-like SNL6 [Prosopis cineraria]|uniref:cinnamoyl-CoA reductase-like SNL6 n=1 Tax=Prosopis cineraria TaxID=364024 RepID=UPI00240F1EA3|nr:cinnamoyl-CoA reductase-like SNL6 [Prosopis cineraria]